MEAVSVENSLVARALATAPTGVFINGTWREARGDGEFDVINPATGNVITRVADADAEDGLAALEAAAAAQESWARTAPRARAELLRNLFEIVVERAEEFAVLMTIEMGKPLAEARIETRIDPELPALYVHPALVEQAIFNVMENAAKFSPPDTPVRVHAVRLGEARMRIDVADAGPGIPEDERRRIFDMFYSVERGDRGGQGTGLGLAIVQGIVGAHMGAVEAVPGPDGRGTVVRIELPLWDPHITGATVP